MKYKIEHTAPVSDAFANLRIQVKWQNPDDKTLKVSIEIHCFGSQCTTLIS